MPLHVSGWTYYMMSNELLKSLRNPGYRNLRPELIVIMVWVLSFILVIPYRLYIRYIDLGKILSDHRILKHQFEGVGICTVKVLTGTPEYIKGVFIVLCLIPLTLTLYGFRKISEQLNLLRIPQTVMCYNDSIAKLKIRLSENNEIGNHFTSISLPSKTSPKKVFLDIRREKISLKYLTLMLIFDILPIMPLKIVRLLKLLQSNVSFVVSWNYELTFITLVWFAFLPTCIMPFLYGTWQLSL